MTVARPHLFWWLLIVSGMLHCGQMAFIRMLYNPFPWMAETDAQFYCKAIFVSAVVAHILEASYAFSLCLRNDIVEDRLGWLLQTLILGFPSLRALKQRIHQTKRK